MKTPEFGNSNPGDQKELRTWVRSTLDQTPILPAYYYNVELLNAPEDDIQPDYHLTHHRILLPPVWTPEMAKVKSVISRVGATLGWRAAHRLKTEFDTGKISKDDFSVDKIITRSAEALAGSQVIKTISEEIVGYYSGINGIPAPRGVDILMSRDRKNQGVSDFIAYYHSIEFLDNGKKIVDPERRKISAFIDKIYDREHGQTSSELIESVLHEWLHHWYHVLNIDHEQLDISGNLDRDHTSQFASLERFMGIDTSAYKFDDIEGTKKASQNYSTVRKFLRNQDQTILDSELEATMLNEGCPNFKILA